MKIKKTWEELKTMMILKPNHILQCSESEWHYLVWFSDNGDSYFCQIEKDDPALTDQLDFETNFKASCNKPTHPSAVDTTPYVRVTEKPVGMFLQVKGIEFTAKAGETTDYYLDWDEDIEFTGARAKVYEESTGEAFANFGDKAQMYFVDKDNILGYGAGLIITQFGKDVPGKILEWGCVTETTTSATLMEGLYLKISYTNTGNTDLKVCAVLKYYH